MSFAYSVDPPCKRRIGQNCVFTSYVTVYLKKSLQKIIVCTPYRWFWPTLFKCSTCNDGPQYIRTRPTFVCISSKENLDVQGHYRPCRILTLMKFHQGCFSAANLQLLIAVFMKACKITTPIFVLNSDLPILQHFWQQQNLNSHSASVANSPVSLKFAKHMLKSVMQYVMQNNACCNVYTSFHLLLN